VRFEQRFHFRLSAQAERLIKNALSLRMLDNLSGARLFNEFRHVLEEREASSCLRRLEGWKLLQMIHPLLRLTPAKDILIANADEALAWHRLLYRTPAPRCWVIYLLALCSEAKYMETAAVLERFSFTERAGKDFLALREAVRAAASRLAALHRQGGLPLSALYDSLRGLAPEGLIFLMAGHQEEEIGRDISLFLTSLRDARLDISGSDLEAMGFPPGPEFGETLKRVLHARIDRLVGTREEQADMARRILLDLRGKPQGAS
jgi:tRNA nucleotidyltransferase (CCA-adding enzyme)